MPRCDRQLCGSLTTLLVAMAAVVAVVRAVPTDRLQQAGPCVGMDCLHGVLMHGDSKSGDSHTNEDTYNRLQEQDQAALSRQSGSGPCVGEDCLHSLLHGEHTENSSPAAHAPPGEAQMGPQQEGQEGPCQGMDCLHGVLMHADQKLGNAHEFDDMAIQQPPSPAQRGPDPSQPRDERSTPSSDETERAAEMAVFQAVDPDEFMHGAHDTHEDARDTATRDSTRDSARDSTRDSTHASTHDSTRDLQVDPDAMMHPGHGHDEKLRFEPESGERSRPGTRDLEAALHGGEEGARVHTEGLSPKHIINKVRPGTFDPHETLHGGDAHAHDERKQDESEAGVKAKLEEHRHRDRQRTIERSAEEGGDVTAGYSLHYISDGAEEGEAERGAKYTRQENLLDDDFDWVAELERLGQEVEEVARGVEDEIAKEYRALKQGLNQNDQKEDQRTNQKAGDSEHVTEEGGAAHAHPSPYSSSYRTDRDTAL